MAKEILELTEELYSYKSRNEVYRNVQNDKQKKVRQNMISYWSNAKKQKNIKVNTTVLK